MIFRAIFASPVGRRAHRAASRAWWSRSSSRATGRVVLNDWNQPFYDAITRRDLNDFLYQLGVYFVIVGVPARARRLAALAHGDHQAPPSRRPDARFVEALDGAASRVLARDQRRSAGREPRSAHQRGCAEALRHLGRSLDRPVPFERAARELRGRALDDLRGLHVPRRRRRLRRAGLHAVGSDFLRRRGLAALLLRRPQPDPAQRRPLRARSGSAVRARAHQRARRRHRARRRRGRRAPPRRNAHRQRRARDAPPRSRPHESHLGDGRIRLDHGHRADPRRGAAVFQRQNHVRRHDDGGRRVHAGARLAALVRRQLRRDRGLARHAAARGELQSGAGRHRIAAGRRQPNRVRRRRARHDGVRRPRRSIRPSDAKASRSSTSSSAPASTC